MEDHVLKETLLEILSRVMESVNVIGNEDDPLPVDSIMLLEIITIIDSEFSISISDSEIFSIESFNDLMGLVKKKLHSCSTVPV